MSTGYSQPSPPRPEAGGGAELPTSTPPAPLAAAPTAPAVPKVPSEEDIPIYGRRVHVHGPLAHHETHEVHPHNPHAGVNYARAAREEMHDVATNPPPTSVVPGAATGVEAWDRVVHELPSRRDRHHRGDLERTPSGGPHQ